MFSVAYNRYVLTVMTAVYVLNQIDRGLMILLLQPIKDDLGLSDTQLGFVTGIAFALFYATLGIPIARWADRGDRSTISSLTIGLWGLTVMACVFVTNYSQLVLVRIAAAIGESGGKPPTYSLLGDYFPEATARTRAMSIYMMGGPLAVLASFIVGGWLNELYGWRATFFLMGIPGVILAILVKSTITEPRARNGYRQEKPASTLRTVLITLWRQRSLRHLCLALTVIYTIAQGMAPWYAAFMVRSHGMGTRELGIWLGLSISLGGCAGALTGGYVASRWFRGNERGQMRLSAVVVAMLMPCYLAFLTLPQKHAALIVLFPIMIAMFVFQGPVYALMQRLVVDEMRATMLAVVLMLANLIGMGVGPQVVGILSDLLRPLAGVESLRCAMLVMSFLALWAASHFWQAGRTVKADLLAVHRSSLPSNLPTTQPVIMASCDINPVK